MPDPAGVVPAALAITEAADPEALAAVQDLLAAYGREYAPIGGLAFGEAVARMPEGCGSPDGCLLLARWGTEPAGCIGLAPREGGDCELLRLYVRPALRTKRVGRALMARALDAARRRGYRRAYLGTLPEMEAARRLYAALGFTAEAAPRGGAPRILRMGIPL